MLDLKEGLPNWNTEPLKAGWVKVQTTPTPHPNSEQNGKCDLFYRKISFYFAFPWIIVSPGETMLEPPNSIKTLVFRYQIILIVSGPVYKICNFLLKSIMEGTE